MNEIRDPVHGCIKFPDCIKNVINTSFMQRLKYCSQLGSVDQVFPGGVHNRFIHSIGCMYLTKKYIKHLSKTCDVLGDKLYLAMLCGLLHDIGHGPFSHSFDVACYTKIYDENVNPQYPDGGHDIHRNNIINHPEMRDAILSCGTTPEELSKVWNATSNDGIYFVINTIVGGSLGADRMDFIMRDAYFCGTQHFGTIAHERIIHSSSILIDNDKFIILFKFNVLNDIINTLEGRRCMYDEVYLHKNAIAGSILVDMFLQGCVKELNLVEKTINLEYFKDLDENVLSGLIYNLPDDSETRKIYMLYKRRIFPKFLSENIDTDLSKKRDSVSIDGKIITFTTRPYTGIDPKKFDYYNMKFINRKNEILSCSDALNAISFKSPLPYRKIFQFEMV